MIVCVVVGLACASGQLEGAANGVERSETDGVLVAVFKQSRRAVDEQVGDDFLGSIQIAAVLDIGVV